MGGDYSPGRCFANHPLFACGGKREFKNVYLLSFSLAEERVDQRSPDSYREGE